MIFNEGDHHKPSIKFDKETGTLSVTGSSYPENAEKVYYPVLDWLSEFDFVQTPKMVLHISLKYYNTATSKKLFEIIKKYNQAWKNGQKAEIRWEYMSDDEDMFESGRYYSELVEVPFHFIEIPD